MSWYPADLVSDRDLLAYEQTILTQFGKAEWEEKRRKTLEDWLFPLLAASGYNPYQLRTRYQAASVLGQTSGVWADYTSASREAGEAGIPIGSVLATGDDALYIGAPWQFRGLSVRMFDDVSSTPAVLRVEAWRDAWTPVSVTDHTVAATGVPLSKGGALTWRVPDDWVVRPLHTTTDALYWVRVRLSTAPTGAAVGQIGVIRRSVLSGPATLRTLGLIFREARTQQEGPWQDKADQYLAESEEAWQRVQALLGREFDTDPVDDQIDATEATRTSDQVTGGAWTLERA